MLLRLYILFEMKLSKNFTLEECNSSRTADRMGIDNVPKDEKVIENLRNLCLEVLQPLRDYVGAPVHINSGYRCKALNEAVGGVKNSQHCLGEACDIRLASSKQGREWATWIEDNCRFDQMLLEKNKNGAVWLHVSCKMDTEANRQVFSRMDVGGLTRGKTLQRTETADGKADGNIGKNY